MLKKDIQNLERHIQEEKKKIKDIHLTLTEIKWMRLPNWCTDIDDDENITEKKFKKKAERKMTKITTMKNIKQTTANELQEKLKELASLKKSLWIHKIQTTPIEFTAEKYPRTEWRPSLGTIQEVTTEPEEEETTEDEGQENGRSITRLQRFLSWICCFSKN
ncbi:uncharacterized protein ACNLHF_011970 [Anomaloglossus baeobatrachus]|uniref:uncharacterized protein LOC142295380 isoform X2 n=1 Tax=Anomaloglossus baeobatrachus TaxID=238106 RepID=UPI003F4F5CAA